MLPPVTDLAGFRRLRRDRAAQRPAFEALARRHGLQVDTLVPFADGTHLVWRAGASVIKLYVPLWSADAEVEVAMLDHLAGTGLPVPELEARGTQGAFPYVIMSHLPGRPTGEVWPALDPRTRLRLAAQMGEQIARLHALPVPGLPVRTLTCEALVAERLPLVLAEQADRGAGNPLLVRIADTVDALGPVPPAESVLLHADLTADHFLVEGERITGLIDFADAFVGPWTYELAAPASFTVTGDPDAQRALLDGMGRAPGPELTRAVRAWALLHRYAHVAARMRDTGHTALDAWLEEVWSA